MSYQKKIIYITYDSVLEPLGQSQVLKYISKSNYNKNILLLSFEKEKNFSNKKNLNYTKDIINDANIKWEYFLYSNKFWILSKIIDILKIIFFIFKKKIKHKVKIIHARSYLPGFAVYISRFFINTKFIFDMRGFWIDERFEWNIWSNKNIFTFKILKQIEKKIIKSSSKIVVLSKDAKKILINKFKYDLKNISVIPTCADENQFNISKKKYWRNELNICHLGTIGSRYNIDFTLKFYKLLNKHIKTKILFINDREKLFIKNNCKKYRINKMNYEIKSIKYYEVHNTINNFDFSVFFPKKGYFINGFFPTKIAESLLSGVPIITSKINNDIDKRISKNNIGIQIDQINEENILRIMDKIKNFKKNNFKIKLRNYAIKNLSLVFAKSKYDIIYNVLLKK